MDATVTTSSGEHPLSPGDQLHQIVVVASKDGTERRRIVLGDPERRVGREVTAPDLRLNDRRVSRHHARIRRADRVQRYRLDDLGAKNGTFVNSLRTESRVLEDGDVIRIGDSLLVYEIGTGPVHGDPDAGAGELVGGSTSTRALRAELSRVAEPNVTVLLSGATGTGKEVAARLIHRLSGRTGEFVPVNCGALPETLAESALFGHRRGAFTGAMADQLGFVVSADRGTLFLDEVADLPATGQAALLRVLEDHQVVPLGAVRGQQVDLRVIAATHVDLDRAVTEGRFRSDLLARLRQWPIQLRPLRATGRHRRSLSRPLPGARHRHRRPGSPSRGPVARQRPRAAGLPVSRRGPGGPTHHVGCAARADPPARSEARQRSERACGGLRPTVP